MGGAGKASRELSVDDYLIEGVSMFNAHTELAAGGECVFIIVYIFCDNVCILLLTGFRP
jgi:hypothetical protein